MTSPEVASLARVPCTIVTGFLGAGKTTLIRHVLANANGRRIAVIVNEFGDVGIDGEILKGCGDAACPEDNIVELANGCHGYLPPPDQFELGGYTTWRARSSYLEVGAEPEIRHEVLSLLKQVALSKKP